MEKMEKLSVKEVEAALSKAMHPEISYSLVKLGMVKEIEVKDASVSLTLLLPFLGIPIKEDLINIVKEAVSKLGKDLKIEIKTSEMNEEEKKRFIKLARDGWAL